MAKNPYLDIVIKATKALPKAGTALAKKAATLQPLPVQRSLPIDIVPKQMERSGMGTTVLNQFNPEVNIDRGAVGADPVGDLASRGYSMWRDAMRENIESKNVYGMGGMSREKSQALEDLVKKYVSDEANRIKTSAGKLYDRSRDEGEIMGILKEGAPLAKNILWDAPIGAVGAGMLGGIEMLKGTPLEGASQGAMELLSRLPEKARGATLAVGKTPILPALEFDEKGNPLMRATGPSIENVIGESNLVAASELARDAVFGGQFGALAKGAKGVARRVGDADYRQAFTESALPELAPFFYGGDKKGSVSFAGSLPGGKQVSQFVEGLVKGEGALNKVPEPSSLLQEAKKYKTFEEYKESLGNRLQYRGGREKGAEQFLELQNNNTGGLFFTEDRNYAKGYAKTNELGGEGGIYEVVLPKNIRIFDIKNKAHIEEFRKNAPTKMVKSGEYDSLIDAQKDVNRFIEEMQSTKSSGAADWATISQFSDELANAGFDGFRAIERPGTIGIDGKITGKPIYSTALFKGGIPAYKDIKTLYNQAHSKNTPKNTTMYGGLPGSQGVSRFVEGLVAGEKTLKEKMKNVSTDIPEFAGRTKYNKDQEAVLAEAKQLGVSLDDLKAHTKGQYDELLKEEINYLNSSKGQGVTQGNIIRDASGDVVGRQGRQSNNPQWYRDFYAEKGRAPNKGELAMIAIQNLTKGSGDVPKNDFFIELQNKLNNIEDIKTTKPNSLSPEVQFAGNIKMKNIGSTDDARALININADRFKRAGIVPQGERVSLEQMRKEANELAESVGINRSVVEKWAKESEENRAKITATRQELSDRSSAVTTLIKQLQENPTDKNLKTQVSESLRELQYLQLATNKMIAESARTLGANRIKTLETDSAKIEQYIKENIDKDPTALAEYLSEIPLKDLPGAIKKLASPSFIDRVMSVRQASLLTDPRTWERNILGNLAGSQLRKIQKPIDIISNQIIQRIKGEPVTRSWVEMNTGKYKKLIDKKEVAKWLEEYASSGNKYEGSQSKRWFVEKGAQKVFDFLEYQDTFFKKAIAKDVIASAAKRTAKFEGLSGKDFDMRVKDLLKNPTDSMFQEMAKTALEWTYQTTPSGRLYKSAQAIRNIPVAGKLAVPFLKTVWNLGRMSLERTVIGQPVNLARMIKGKNSPEQALSNLLLATALQSVISAGVETGAITGTERDPKKRILREAEGLKDDLINTPLGSFSYKNLEPVSTIIGSGVDLHNAMKGVFSGEQGIAGAIGQTGFSVADRFVNNSFLRGVSDMLDLIPSYQSLSGRNAEERSVGNWGEYGAKQIASFYPRAFNWLEEIVGGQKVQRPEGTGEGMENFLSGIANHITASTPFISGEIPVKIDIWGNEIQKQQVTSDPTINNILNALVPVQLEKKKEDPVNKELLRLKYYPQAPQQSIDGYRMTNKEYEQYMKVVGKETKNKLDVLITEDKYKSAQESDKVDMIKKIMSAVKKEHKNMFYDKINEAKINQYKEAQQSGDTVTAENLLESLQKTVQKTPPQERKTADSERSRMKAEMKRKMMSEEKKKEFSTLASEIKDMEYNEGKAYVLKKYPRIDRVSLDNFLVWAYGGAEF